MLPRGGGAGIRRGCALRLGAIEVGVGWWRCGLGGAGVDQPHNRAWARRKTAASGQLEAMATRMRRTLRVTRAPIFRSFRRMLPQVAVASSVPAAIRRTSSTCPASTRSSARATSRSRSSATAAQRRGDAGGNALGERDRRQRHHALRQHRRERRPGARVRIEYVTTPASAYAAGPMGNDFILCSPLPTARRQVPRRRPTYRRQPACCAKAPISPTGIGAAERQRLVACALSASFTSSAWRWR